MMARAVIWLIEHSRAVDVAVSLHLRGRGRQVRQQRSRKGWMTRRAA